MILRPTNESVARFMLETLEHSIRVEYYLARLKIGKFDIQRPHDIYGFGNKFEWEEGSEVLPGFASQYDKLNFFIKLFRVHRSIDTHRRYQRHHQVWNKGHKKKEYGEEELDQLEKQDLMKLAAVDTLCSRMEHRVYQDDVKSFEELRKAVKGFGPQAWTLSSIYKQMREYKKPDFGSMKSITDVLDNINKFRLQKDISKLIVIRMNETVEMLVGKGYNKQTLLSYT